MFATIISRYSFALLDTITVTEYELAYDADYNGKSQFVFFRKPVAEEDDFILLHDGSTTYQGIISAIENEKGEEAYTVTAIEMQKLFDQKVILRNEELLTTGIEDFIVNQIQSNFIFSEDDLLNIDYLTAEAMTHTPVAAKVDAEDGVYNLCTYLGNAMTNYGIFVEFEFARNGLHISVEKKPQSDLKIDTGLANIVNLSEIYETKALAKLTVIWNKTEHETVIDPETEEETQTEYVVTQIRHFFLRTDRTITEDMEDPERAKGSVDVIVSTADTEEEMIQEAQNKFTSNSYQHKITFDVIPSKLVTAADLYVGHKLQVKTSIGIKDSIITGIETNNQSNSVYVTLGQMKVTLIEKLKGVELK